MRRNANSAVQEEGKRLLAAHMKPTDVIVGEALYSVSQLAPNRRNHRQFKVTAPAVVRLNSTMESILRGNSQIFVTSLYKDVPREKLIVDYWNGLIETPEFKAMPAEMQEMFRQQAAKLGPTSRLKPMKLAEGLVNHISEEAKTKAQYSDAFREIMVEESINYYVKMVLEFKRRRPDDWRKIQEEFSSLGAAYQRLNKNKAGGDPLFVRVDREIGDKVANDEYLRLAERIQGNEQCREVWYTLYARVQPGGNNLIPKEIGKASLPPDGMRQEAAGEGNAEGYSTTTPSGGKSSSKDERQPGGVLGHETPTYSAWKEEKNRVVQGDSRAVQFVQRGISNIFTAVLPKVDPNFIGWVDPYLGRDEKIGEFMRYWGRRGYVFDSFDATDYDASTDPRNFESGIRIMYGVCEKLGLPAEELFPLRVALRHYLHDPVLTPWGAYHRNSTPSGHNFTGPNGTITNALRMDIQNARMFLDKRPCAELTRDEIRRYFDYKYQLAIYEGIPVMMMVGDDAVSPRKAERDEASIAEENNFDGYKMGDISKLLVSKTFIHFLQRGYYYLDDTHYLFGVYPGPRVMEHSMFQEHADQYDSITLETKGMIQNLWNALNDPTIEYTICFMLKGDPKYRLGSIYGSVSEFVRKAVPEGVSVAEYYGREWDPSYVALSWEEHLSRMQVLYDRIEECSRKLGYIK